MNEELLKIIEAMEAAGESPEEIAKVVQAYDAPNIEKKKTLSLRLGLPKLVRRIQIRLKRKLGLRYLQILK